MSMKAIKTMVVCGAGTMGSGIAQVAAQAGYQTFQYDLHEEMLTKSKAAIHKNLQWMVDKGRMTAAEKNTIIDRIHFTNQAQECVGDLILEAIIEKTEAKQALFNQMAAWNGAECIFATNTSSISVTAIASGMEHASRVAGMHFFNPAPLMKLVEVIRGEQTSPDVIDALVEVCKKMGKVPVVCKDAPGFIVNRVARPYYLEAMYLVEKGWATMETVDQLMEATGFKMGPFKLMDLIGLDINYGVSQIVWEALGKPERLTPSALQKYKVEAGELGKKTNQGFYHYTQTNTAI